MPDISAHATCLAWHQFCVNRGARTAAYLDRLIASVVEGDADVNGAIVVDLVENEVGGLRPQASIVWHCDGCLQAS